MYPEINAENFDKHPIGPDWPEMKSPIALDPTAEALTVAIVGSGPAACYAAAELADLRNVQVNIFDRLPTPYGLARAGVAPDHPGTKAVTDVFHAALSKPSVDCYFNVAVGEHITHHELLERHHAVIYAVGAASARRLGIPGEDLPGSHAVTEFVAWYNGHPDYSDRTFDLTGETAVIVGNGNVALDVARVLLTDPDQLAKTDIADYALDALRHNNIREVTIVGRRGPAQAAYTSPELIALGQMDEVDIIVDPAEAVLDPTTQAWIDGPNSELSQRLKVLQAESFSKLPETGASKRIVLRYLASPETILGDGHAEGVQLVRNELVPDSTGNLAARPTNHRETLTTSLILRSIGYRGRPVAGLPFDEACGIIPNEDGRVVDPSTGIGVAGVYVAGWIKRGPSGVIGTNKYCSASTVEALLEDFSAGLLTAPNSSVDNIRATIVARRPQFVDFKGWQRINIRERTLGAESLWV